ncbi:glycosyltransferase family 1 protein [Dendronalium sp. ChiSLP03b]|uniref:glycosyltransferase family 4 protein n=1 Tax=Dendronalium sp. ChiSLP03b TaxID=3075381 RepID=UPI002AD2CE8F|nr:glycosyltransferase family 1 protein [Dendronalium sp. ChiSLP03b]MDZ8202850.1 glycosyltransferase family 1 protein [Dendronalium sp. ChiSLP03b]
MRVAILRRTPQVSFSMDVYADGLVSGLKAVRPTWEIVEFAPAPYPSDKKNSVWLLGLWKYYERYWRYPRMIEKQNADIFHIIDHSDGHLARWLKRKAQPKIVTCHDLINLFQPENIYSRTPLPFVSMAAWKFAIRGMEKADRIISVSAHTAKDVINNLKIAKENITVVPDAIESIFRILPKTVVEPFRQQNGVSPETLCLLNVGSNHPRKNVFTILKVMKALKEQGLPVYFWKTGADFTPEQKIFIQTHDLQNFVAYLGKPDKEKLVQIYNAADVLIAPSLYEGFGMTILEAMACGTPVITSNVTSLPEVAGNAAILVEPLDVQAMVKAVCCLLEDSIYRQSLIEAGLARVKPFTWENTAEQIATVYETMLKER